MKIRDDIIIYGFSQYTHNQSIRREYRITQTRFNIFLSIYYATKITPKKRGLKSRIMTLNPQLNQVFIEKTLSILASKGLIVYERTESKHKYTLELTKEGLNVISSLYSVQSIDGLIDKY